MNALIICNDTSLSWYLPYLLHRAGFAVDTISKTGLFTKSRFVSHTNLIPYQASVADHAIKLIKKNPNKYQWIVVCEDQLLLDILNTSTTDEIKLKILPVLSTKDFRHLFSKIGLAEVLSENGIKSPNYACARNVAEAIAISHKLNFPLLLKKNSSHGGQGIIECANQNDLEKASEFFKDGPALLQEKLSGDMVDLSAIYQQGNLIHYSHSYIVRCTGRFGPSVVRDYVLPQDTNQKIIRELQKIGNALGANGFVNISCVEREGEMYFFEADMRPNVWQDFTSYIHTDPAKNIRNWFQNNTCIKAEDYSTTAKNTRHKRLPYFLRLKKTELLRNRYQCWSYIPLHDRKLVAYLLLNHLITRPIISFIQKFTTQKLRHTVRQKLANCGIF